jgi:hypothetical protein
MAGWAWDPSRPSERLRVDLSVDGKSLWRRRLASSFRGDLLAAGIGDGQHAFSIELPLTVFDGEPHQLDATFEDTGEHIPGSPLHYQSDYAGAMHGVSLQGAIEGWLKDRTRPGAALIAEIYADGNRLLGTAPVDGKNGEGHFAVPIAQSIDLQRFQRIELRAEGCARTLAVAKPESAGEPYAVIHRMRNALADSPEVEEEFLRIVAPLLHSQPVRRTWLRMADPHLKPIAKGAAFRRSLVDLVVLGSSAGSPDDILKTLESVGHSSIAHPLNWILRIDGLENEATYKALQDASRDLGFRIQIGGDPFTFHMDRDLVLLSSGATVSGNWLDRLRHAVYSSPRIGSASPVIAHVESLRKVAALCERQQNGKLAFIDGPSDLCVYIRRDCLEELRTESPTMPLSASEALANARHWGWQHVLAGDVVVNAPGSSGTPPAPHHPLARIVAEAQQQPLTAPGPFLIRCTGGDTVWIGDVSYLLPSERTELLEALHRLEIRRFAVDAIIDAPLELFNLGIPYELTVRDYSWICPRVDLVDETRVYCGEPVIQGCERCLRKLGPRADWGSLLLRSGSVAEMREQNRKVLEGADLVHFLSQDSADRILRYAPRINRWDIADPVVSGEVAVPAQGSRAVAFFGDQRILQACRFDVSKRKLPLEFEAEGASIGLYANTSPDLDAATLSVMFEQNLFPVAFDLGATAAVMRAASAGRLLPLHTPVRQINDTLLELLR